MSPSEISVPRQDRDWGAWTGRAQRVAGPRTEAFGAAPGVCSLWPPRACRPPRPQSPPRCCELRLCVSEAPQDSWAGVAPPALAVGPAPVQLATVGRGQVETWERWDLSPHLEAPSPQGSEGAGRRQQEPGQESRHPKEAGQGCSQGAVCSPSSERLEPPRASWAKPRALRASSMCWPFKGCIVSSSSLGIGPEPHACHWPPDPPPSCTSAQDADSRAEQRSDCSKPSLSHASGARRAEQDLTGHPDVKDPLPVAGRGCRPGCPVGSPPGSPRPPLCLGAA